MKQLESRIGTLQQNLLVQKEETEMIRRERDELQNEVYRLEKELSQQQQMVHQLEGQERRLSMQSEVVQTDCMQKMEELKEENESLTVFVKGMNEL